MWFQSNTQPSETLNPAVPAHLDAGFAAWWSRSSLTHPERSVLAQRCALAFDDVPLDFGEVYDWVWADVARLSDEQLLASVQHHGAILMAQPTPLVWRLQGLPHALRAWALPIASVQPVPRLIDWSAHPDMTSLDLGLAELGLWIAADFSNLWPRVLRQLDAAQCDGVCALVHEHSIVNTTSAQRRKVLRCWRLAMQTTLYT